MRKRRIQLASHDLVGVRFALNVLIASAILWYLLRHVADTNPVWAIASMVASSEPQVKEARRMFVSRITNVSIGGAVGLALLMTGGAAEWKLPLALAIAVLVSSYLIHVQTMWRQAPITAALVVSSGLLHESRVTGIESGLHKVAEVVVGCLIGVGVSWLMSKVWPLHDGHSTV